MIDPTEGKHSEVIQGGLRQLCISKQCGLSMTCEHAQSRTQSVNVVDLWQRPENALNTKGNCMFFQVRKELNSGDVPRAKARKGGRRQNKLTGKNMTDQQVVDAIKKLGPAPDLLVKRHIKDGKNIKGDN